MGVSQGGRKNTLRPFRSLQIFFINVISAKVFVEQTVSLCSTDAQTNSLCYIGFIAIIRTDAVNVS